MSEQVDVDVLVLGGAGVDTIVHVPALPLPYADSYPVPGTVTRAGQTGDGVALGVHTLGLRTHLVDVLGDDPEGQLVRELHARHGVEFTAISTPAGTRRAVNLVDPGGRRLSLYDSSRGGTEPVPAAALPGPAVDSNGAGDAFVSGFLFGFLTGHDAVTSCRWGAVAGAHACTVPATRVDPIRRDQLRPASA